MLYSCFFLLRIIDDADKCGTEETVADTISAAHFVEYLVVREIGAIHAFQSFVNTGIEANSYGFDGSDIEGAQYFFHLLDDEFDPGAQLLNRACGAEGQLEIVEDGKKLFHRAGDREIAEVTTLARFALAGIFKFRLQTREAVDELIPLGPDAFDLTRCVGGRLLVRCFLLLSPEIRWTRLRCRSLVRKLCGL